MIFYTIQCPAQGFGEELEEEETWCWARDRGLRLLKSLWTVAWVYIWTCVITRMWLLATCTWKCMCVQFLIPTVGTVGVPISVCFRCDGRTLDFNIHMLTGAQSWLYQRRIPMLRRRKNVVLCMLNHPPSPTPGASEIRTQARPWQVESLSCMAWRAWLAMVSGS